jgi:hypothetical protein
MNQPEQTNRRPDGAGFFILAWVVICVFGIGIEAWHQGRLLHFLMVGSAAAVVGLSLVGGLVWFCIANDK